MRGPARAALAVALLLAGCSVASVETPDPAAIPSGTPPVPSGATGPVSVIGSGQSQGLGWRYLVYPAGDDWCDRLEIGGGSAGGCGDLVPAGDEAFGSIGHSEQVVSGWVVEETATVWLVVDGGGRLPATLLSLEPAGVEGNAFVGIAPPGTTITHLQAVAFNGEVLQTYEIPQGE